MTTYPMTANARFAIGDNSLTVTVEGVPFEWDTDAGNRDEQAVLAVLKTLPHGFGAPLSLIWVETSPRKGP